MRARFFALLFLLAGLPLSAVDTSSPPVLSIEVVPQNLGGTTFIPAKVTAEMQTKVGAPFLQNEFDEDLKKLAAEYDRVEPLINYRENGVHISIRIWFKPSIRSIAFKGNDKIPSDKLAKELDIFAGQVFEREAFITGFNKLKTFYIKKGYFEADLDFAIIEDPQGCDIDIEIAVSEGKAGFISMITFCGVTDCEEDDLRDLMLTKRYYYFLNWYTGRGCYHPEMIEQDRMIILSYLQDRGYADAMVDLSLVETSARNRVMLRVTVDKGPCYAFGNINICGNTLFTEEQIRDQFVIYEGFAYSPDRLRATAANIRELYGSIGYIDADLDAVVMLREDSCVYDVNITIQEGCQSFVGMVRVFGNTVTQPRVILNEILLCPGDVFDVRKLQGTEERLFNTSFFSEVNAYTVHTARDAEGYRDVFIEVCEQDTGNLGIFFGFNSLQHIFGGVDISERNFNMAGVFDIFRSGLRNLRGAGEYIHFKANFGKRETTYLLQWTIPYFMDSPWILGFDVEKVNNSELSRGYEVKTYGGDVHATYIYNAFVKHDNYYRARHTSVHVTDKKNIALNEEAKVAGFVSALGTALLYDSTNHPRKPTSGFRSRLFAELVGIGGNFHFFKFGYLNSYYYPLSKRGTLKFRVDAQFIKTYGTTRTATVPLSERFFLGGDTTVRGYRPFIIGPKFGNNEPKGGLSTYLLSEEYQYNLLDCPCIDAFVFCDAGYVSLHQFSIGAPAASVGFGIRVEALANAPMTFGFGFPIHPTQKIRAPDGTVTVINNAQRFYFTFGGTF